MEFSEFIGAVQALAEQLSVLADTPDMTSVLTRARELDEICANLDAQVGIGIDCPEPLGVADLARLAENCECVERGNNRHARLGPLGEVIFSLALADVPNRLQLLLDVPRVSSALRPWQQMTDCAMRCAQQLGGSLVDDAGKPLSEVQLARIGEQLQMRYASLREAGFPAGSPLALRLFN
ncbi:MAG: cell division protein ZipA C-terminal FtsZ-binding domain-containing protein [Quisquiliibacterium sp.]